MDQFVDVSLKYRNRLPDDEGLIIAKGSEDTAVAEILGVDMAVSIATDTSISDRITMQLNQHLTRNADGKLDISQTPDPGALESRKGLVEGWMQGMYHVWIERATDEQKAATRLKFGKARTEENFPFEEWMKMLDAYQHPNKPETNTFHGKTVELSDVALQIYAYDFAAKRASYYDFDPTKPGRAVLTNNKEHMTVYQAGGIALGAFKRADGSLEVRFNYYSSERRANKLTIMFIMALNRLYRDSEYSKIDNNTPLNIDISQLWADPKLNHPDIWSSISVNPDKWVGLGPLSPIPSQNDSPWIGY